MILIFLLTFKHSGGEGLKVLRGEEETFRFSRCASLFCYGDFG